MIDGVKTFGPCFPQKRFYVGHHIAYNFQIYLPLIISTLFTFSVSNAIYEMVNISQLPILWWYTFYFRIAQKASIVLGSEHNVSFPLFLQN